MQSIENPIREVIQIIEEKGWIKGSYNRCMPPEGQILDDPFKRNGVCLLWAVKVVGLTKSSSIAESLNIIRLILDKEYMDRDIAHFNDSINIGYEDVMLVLKKAAVEWDEKHAD